mgnify:FL=1
MWERSEYSSVSLSEFGICMTVETLVSGPNSQLVISIMSRSTMKDAGLVSIAGINVTWCQCRASKLSTFPFTILLISSRYMPDMKGTCSHLLVAAHEVGSTLG